MSERRKRSSLTFRVTVGLMLVALYVLSSGPAMMVGARLHTIYPQIIGGNASFYIGPGPERIVYRGVRWHKTYSPVYWVSRQAWGRPLVWYWRQFPIQRDDGKWVRMSDDVTLI